jgi:nucleoside-diphosphate-sugar epimerase
MKIAITGGTGFVGGHFARRVLAEGHDVVLLSWSANRRGSGVNDSGRVTRVSSDLSDVQVLTAAFTGCDAVVHCAGINREIGRQTFQRIHIDGTRNVVEATKRAGVRPIGGGCPHTGNTILNTHIHNTHTGETHIWIFILAVRWTFIAARSAAGSRLGLPDGCPQAVPHLWALRCVSRAK